MPTNAEMLDQWATDDSTAILRTKLHRPPLSPDLVPRTDLTARLDELLQRPVTLISSAAGYGKSTMASLWLEAWDGSYAWVSLGEEENDLRMFLSYLLAAIRSAIPKACEKSLSLLKTPALPPVTVLSRYLLNELNEIEDPLILVLDDYHRIHEKVVHDLMSTFFTYPPQHLHLMLLTRRDPSLLTHQLRSRGQVNEIGTLELRFTTEETAVFVKNTLRHAVDGKMAAKIQDKLEGWPAGMRLMTQSITYSGDLDRLLAGLEGGFSTIVDYLMAEVLEQLSPGMIHLLTATAILDRFCASLCDALLEPDARSDQGEVNGAILIAKLQKNNFFLISLDTANHWFRHHHLFQDLLLQQLKQRRSPEKIATLHLHASQWFAENDLIEEAVQHAIAANDIPTAVKLVEQHRYDLINTEQWNRLHRWMKLLPAEEVDKRPFLLTARGLYLDSCGLLTEAFTILDRIEPLLSTIPSDSFEFNQVHGEYYTLLAERQFISAEPEGAIASSQKALDLLPPEARTVRYLAVLWNSLSHQMNGESKRGVQFANETLNQPSTFKTVDPWKRHLCLCLHHTIDGNLRAVEESAMQARALSEKRSQQPVMTLAFYFLGTVYYWRNELSEAKANIEVILENRYVIRPVYFAICAYLQALIHLASGQAEEAKRLVESVISYGREYDNSAIITLGRAFEVELALRQSRHSEVRRLMTGVNFDLFPPIWLAYHSQLTRLKALISMSANGEDQDAGSQLDKWYEFGRSTHNKSFLIQVLSLQAVLLSKEGKSSAALKKLRESLAMAQPGGFIRTFVDLGPPMADLLKRLHKQNVFVEYIGQILNVFKGEAQGVEPETAGHALSLSKSSQPLVEPLTNRELDVLELLVQRFQNKEIADKLFISPETVKGHLRNIYQKLNVKKRREAVEKAKKIGIV